MLKENMKQEKGTEYQKVAAILFYLFIFKIFIAV